jgi:hypothetical protein
MDLSMNKKHKMFNSTFWSASFVVDVGVGPVAVEMAGPSDKALAFLPYQLGFTLLCFAVLGWFLRVCLRLFLWICSRPIVELYLWRTRMRGVVVARPAVAERNMDPREMEAHRLRCELCGRDGRCTACPWMFGDISFETLKPKEKFNIVGPVPDEGPIRQLFERVSPLLDVTFRTEWRPSGHFFDRYTIVVVRKIPGTKAARS